MEVLIPGFREQYSISDRGIIYSNYKYLMNGKKWDRRIVIAKRDHNNVNGRPLNTSVVSLRADKNKTHTFFVNSLMAEIFKIKPPDKHHYYDLICKDGNVFNNRIDNIGFKIRMEIGSNYNFYPQPFYNNSGKITHKICAVCGEKKSINHFHYQKPKKKGYQRTYRNVCEQCRGHKQWDHIRANPILLKKVNERRIIFEKSIRGREWRVQYSKDRHQYEYKHITRRYVYTSLKLYQDGLNVSDVNDELYKLSKKRILLYRKRRCFKQLKTQ
jgi:hypothetical protein